MVICVQNKKGKIFVTGPLADNLGAQCGGWTIKWGGVSDPLYNEQIKGTTILDGIKTILAEHGGKCITDKNKAHTADATIVVIGELPYSEWQGDIAKTGKLDLYDQPTTANGNRDALILAKKLKIPIVVIIISGRPLLISKELPGWDACIAAWLPGTEGAAIADLLFGKVNFKGKLPVTWPGTIEQLPINIRDKGYGKGQLKPLFPYGYGL